MGQMYIIGNRSLKSLGRIQILKVSVQESPALTTVEAARTPDGKSIYLWLESSAEQWVAEANDRLEYMRTGKCDHRHTIDTTKGMPCVPLLECRICGKFPVNLPKSKAPTIALYESIPKDQWIPTGIRWKMAKEDSWTYQEGLVHARIDGWNPYAYELVYTCPVKVQEG